MKLYAHVGPNGDIQGLVTAPDGEDIVMLTPEPGVRVYEIQDHGIKGDTPDIEQLEKLIKSHKVDATPARAKLVRRKK